MAAPARTPVQVKRSTGAVRKECESAEELIDTMTSDTESQVQAMAHASEQREQAQDDLNRELDKLGEATRFEQKAG